MEAFSRLTRYRGFSSRPGWRHASTPNPLYLAAIGVALGISLWVNGVFPLVLLIPMSAVLHWGIVLREEKYLLGKFGPEYEVYCSRVRRWL